MANTFKNRPVQLIKDVSTVNPLFDYTRKASAENPYEILAKAGSIIDHPDGNVLVDTKVAIWYDVPPVEPAKPETMIIPEQIPTPSLAEVDREQALFLERLNNQATEIQKPATTNPPGPTPEPAIPAYAYGGMDLAPGPDVSVEAVVAVPPAAAATPAPIVPVLEVREAGGVQKSLHPGIFDQAPVGIVETQPANATAADLIE